MANLFLSEPSTKPAEGATNIESERIIAHLDMDAFYASVELLDRPDLQELPVIVGGRGEPNSRGVVTTCNYKAREFGVRSGMPLRTAAKLCPEAVYLPVNFDRYRHYSRLFKAAIGGICDQIEDRGIDEVYIDLTLLSGGNFEQATRIATAIKAAVFDATQLTCSVGLAPNKLIAKIASDLNKPNGLCTVRYADLERLLWPLPVRKINGVGPRAYDKLAMLGIDTIGALAATPLQVLLDRFGSGYGRWLHDSSWGRDQRLVELHSEPKTRSRETTFDRDLHPKNDWHELAAIVAKLSLELAQDLQKRKYFCKTIGVKLRYDNFVILSRDISLREPSFDSVAIRKAAFECLARAQPQRKLRLVGVRASGIVLESELGTRLSDPRAHAGSYASSHARIDSETIRVQPKLL